MVRKTKGRKRMRNKKIKGKNNSKNRGINVRDKEVKMKNARTQHAAVNKAEAPL